MPLTPQRIKRLEEVALRRQLDFTVILENVHDPHNLGAVMRTCDSIGVAEVHVIYTDPRLDNENLKLGKRSSAGTRKWVDVFLYRDIDSCLEKFTDYQILGAYLDESSPSLYSLDLTVPTALVFGNEHEGLSDELRQRTDGSFFIPQVGMVKSLNISVACAVSLYETLRQRQKAGLYDKTDLSERSDLLQAYIDREGDKFYGMEPKNNK
ncbi:MAG: RNA methyltransferase [Saprospiraceae bacterium]|nr:RNA methyltransferase [Saprospiraceae bacterium]